MSISYTPDAESEPMRVVPVVRSETVATYPDGAGVGNPVSVLVAPFSYT